MRREEIQAQGMKSMDRRSFVKAAAMVPLAMAQAPVAFAAFSGETSSDTGPALGGMENERFELTLRRVLEGDSPRFTEEFLLADVKPTQERRFTE